jgi:site-specific recombinase XerD
MLETYFVAPKTLRRLRTGPSGPYIDGFAGSLEQEGFSHACAIRYLRAAAHLGHFVHQQGCMLMNTDSSTAEAFFHHFATCHCPHSNGGQRNHHTYFGAKRYRAYLVTIGVCQDGAKSEPPNPETAVVVGFRHWLRKHRGAADRTVEQYARGANNLIKALGDDPAAWTARGVRGYFVERIEQCGGGTAEKLVTSLRAFLRYLSVIGHCQADLHDAVPAFAAWRLADLPRYLTPDQVDRLITVCDGRSRELRRDRAVVLLLVRLGLRAGDVARLCMDDIEWTTGSIRVTGKGRYQVRLPLPQDVGDAIVDYLELRPQIRNDDHVFVRNIAPYRPFLRGDGVSSVVRRAMKRAGVVTPAKGAHALRHTAATEMLRHGVPLDQIALVLRHRGIDTTAYYAKADVGQLKRIAQPWPETLP